MNHQIATLTTVYSHFFHPYPFMAMVLRALFRAFAFILGSTHVQRETPAIFPITFRMGINGKYQKNYIRNNSFLSILWTLSFTDSSLSFVNLIRKRDLLRGGANMVTIQKPSTPFNTHEKIPTSKLHKYWQQWTLQPLHSIFISKAMVETGISTIKSPITGNVSHHLSWY